MNSDITIIILLFKTPRNLLKNLEVYKKFKIVILDQSYDLTLKKKLSKIFPRLQHYKISKKNNGFAQGINYLVKKVNTKYFFCTQIDVIINYHSILELKKTLIRNKKKAIVSVPKFGKEKNKKNIIDKEINVMTGAAFFCEKKKFAEVGMFDKDYFFYWEDIDFSKKVSKLGFKIYENQLSKAIHNNSNSSINDLSTEFIRKKNFIYGELLFDFKHNKIRFIKIIRKLFQNFFWIILNFSFFKFRNLINNIANFAGILKFVKYLLKI